MKGILKSLKELDVSLRNNIMHSSSLPSRLNFSQVQILNYLCNHEEVCQKDLELYLHLKKSSITGALDSLEEKGLINRVVYEDDKRKKIIKASKTAIDNHKKVMDHMELSEERLLEGINDKDLKVFLRVIEKMKENLKKGD